MADSTHDSDVRLDLFSRHGSLVYAMCSRLADDPEDAAQEIWEKITRAASRFDAEHSTPARAWIATIARRHLIDRHRRQKVRGTAVSPDSLVDPANPETLLRKKSREQRLESAIQQLPPDQRRVVVMHHIHGVPLQTLAQEEAVALGTIKSRLHRGRARLAQLLRTP